MPSLNLAHHNTSWPARVTAARGHGRYRTRTPQAQSANPLWEARYRTSPCAPQCTCAAGSLCSHCRAEHWPIGCDSNRVTGHQMADGSASLTPPLLQNRAAHFPMVPGPANKNARNHFRYGRNSSSCRFIALKIPVCQWVNIDHLAHDILAEGNRLLAWPDTQGCAAIPAP